MLYTVTLNPTIDRTVLLDANLIPGDVNRGSMYRVVAGGKGINCAEAAKGMGVPAAAYTIIGKDNIEEFEKATGGLSSEIRAEMKAGFTRTCVKIKSQNGMTTEINEKGCRISADEMRSLISRILTDMKNEGKPSFVLLCGSVPPEVESGVYSGMIALLQKLGVACMVDCDGVALQNALTAKPFLIKPNLSEFEALMGKTYTNIPEMAKDAKKLATENGTSVLLTIGGDGMLFANSETVYKVNVPDLSVSTTVGAGDTVLGVFAAALSKHLPTEKALQLAGAAACAKVVGQPGDFPGQNQALPYLNQISVVELDLEEKEEAPLGEEEMDSEIFFEDLEEEIEESADKTAEETIENT